MSKSYENLSVALKISAANRAAVETAKQQILNANEYAEVHVLDVEDGQHLAVVVDAPCGDDYESDHLVHLAISDLARSAAEGTVLRYEPGDRLVDVEFIGPSKAACAAAADAYYHDVADTAAGAAEKARRVIASLQEAASSTR